MENQKTNLAKEVSQLIDRRNYGKIKKILPFHPEDIAHLISELNFSSHKLFVFRLVPYDKAVDVFEHLPVEEEEQILTGLNSNEITDILNEMSPDDRTELFDELPAELAKKFINFLSAQKRQVAIELLNYPHDSVGRLITPDFVQLFEGMSVEDALTHIRNVGLRKETVYHCYVLDNSKKLIGIVSLKKIVLAKPNTKISQILSKDVISVSAFTDKEEAADVFKRYDLIVLPVLDNNNKLLGIVTFDDLVDVLEEETTEDFEKAAAVLPVDKPYMDANFFELLWKRSFWLIVLVVFESTSSLVIKSYGPLIQKWIALTFFLPILIATGGNAGIQSAMMIIRGLTIKNISVKDFFKVIFRESLLGLSIGFILALVGIARVLLQEGNQWALSVSVGVSMGVTVLFSAMIGAALPMIFRKLKLDPAFMSGPMITTIVDICGVFIYFQIAALILGI
ncbi:MAG: magnesium transporter [Candidatus Omnitrophica bacterium]|nr:magnesium transporter [Candidatus Omnitrophota bacterium]MCF7893901.1 magnesium transporter [Candidatus Omnitrophota bacterium]